MNNQSFLKWTLKTVFFSLFLLLAKTGYCDVVLTNGPTIGNDTITDILRPNWGNDMAILPDPNPANSNLDPEICVQLTLQGILKISLTVAVAALDIHNYPAMYFHYDFGGRLVGDSPILTEEDFVPYIFNNHQIYQAQFQYQINLSAECDIPGNSFFDIPIYYALMTPSSSGPLGAPKFYPSYLYTDPGQLFGSPVLLQPETGDAEWAMDKPICCLVADPLIAQNPENPSGQLLSASESEKRPTDWIEINEIEEDEGGTPDLSAFPSPFNDFLYLSFLPKQKGPIDLDIYDSMGHLVTSKNIKLDQLVSPTIKVPTADWPAGLYFIRYRSFTGQKILKVLKN